MTRISYISLCSGPPAIYDFCTFLGKGHFDQPPYIYILSLSIYLAFYLSIYLSGNHVQWCSPKKTKQNLFSQLPRCQLRLRVPFRRRAAAPCGASGGALGGAEPRAPWLGAAAVGADRWGWTGRCTCRESLSQWSLMLPPNCPSRDPF